MIANDQACALLREILDLQKSHFEFYREFTAQVLENDSRSQEESRMLRKAIKRQHVIRIVFATLGIITLSAIAAAITPFVLEELGLRFW